MKKRRLSILLSIVMLFSLLPTTALAAGIYPEASAVFVDGNKSFYNPSRLYYKNNNPKDSFTGTPTDYNAAYDPATGTLTLNDYSGGSISTGGTNADITVVLKGTNTIKDGSLMNDMGGDITITSDCGGTLSITNTLSNSNDAIGIEAGLSGSYSTGNVTITGNAEVTIKMTHNGTLGWDNAYGIFAKENITISRDASVDIICATPNNTTGGGNCNGLRAEKNVSIDTNGTIKINVTNAGKDKDNGYSFGVYPKGTAILTKVGNMEVQWKKEVSYSANSGGAFTKKATFNDTDHAINVDTTNCYASYRKGTPYTVRVENGTLAGPGVVSYAKNSGNFLAGDTVNITPDTKTGKSTEEIPFKEWTSSNVRLTSPSTKDTSFKVPANDVTVTATYNPFVGTPTFTPIGSTETYGTLTFKTVVELGDGSEGFCLVKEANVDTTSKYSPINPSKTSTGSPHVYSNTVYLSTAPAGNYYVAELLNGTYYLSEKFTVDYAAATANISLDKTGTMDFGIMEAGYPTAPEAQTVTITNSGTAATGALTIALDGTNFELNKTSISDIMAGNSDTFTVQPKTGLPASTYTATVKVSGTGVTEQSFDVQFTVTAPLTAIAVPTANTGLVYDGTKQTGVNAGAGYTLGGDYEATDVGTTDYTATATLDTGYKWNDGSTGVKTINWNIDKRTPTATDFTFAPPTNLTYDDNNKTANVTLNSLLTNSGAITVKYEKDGASVTETKDVGDYTVKIDVAAGDNFNASSDLTASAWKFSIAPANQSAPTSLGVAAPTASGGNGKITGTTTAMEYSTDSSFASPTDCSNTETEVAPGTYYVRFKAKTNYNAGTVSAALVVPAYSATKYTVTVTSDANGMASTDKTTDIAAGETVTLTATPNSGYVFDQWTDKTPNSLTIGADGKFTMPNGNVSVKATFKGAALTGTASITGTLKYGEELTASLTGTNNTGNLDYTWYQNGTTQIAANNTGKYTLRADDIDKTITVEITSSVQTGKITGSTTGTIDKADGPVAPTAFTLSFTSNSDGTTFTATIPTVAGGEYSFDGTTYSGANTKADCAANTSYTGYVRIAATSTHKASTATSDTQTSPKLTVATPAFTPNGLSSFSGTQSVTITCATVGATIHYTTDGTTPTTSSPVYSTELTLTSTTTVKAIAVKADMHDSAIATATFTKASGGGSFGGGGYVPTVQKPEITIIGSGKADLSADGRTATITAAAGHELVSVVLNGKEMGKVEKLTGLKTGDKATITFRAKTDGKAEMDKIIAQKASKLTLMARSKKTAKLNIKVVVKGDLKAITDAGYTVKYKFYRSTKKSAGYKAVLTKKAPTYYNTYGKKGTMYYYKARVMIYDKDGNFVAQTALKQCKYANRLWTK